MTWLRIDDKFTRHRKVAPLSDAAFRLHVTGMVYSSEFETDGRIRAGWLRAMPSLATGKKLMACVAELLQAGVWVPHEDGDGWQIHDFLQWNPSADQVRSKREARAQAGALGGRRSVEAKLKQTSKQLLEQAASNDAAKFNPVPARPDPISELPSGVARARGEPDGGKEKKKRPVALPESWCPTEEHANLAKKFGLDMAREEAKFRSSAEAHGRTYVSWNGAFSTWLQNAPDFKPNGKPPGLEQHERTSPPSHRPFRRERETMRDMAEFTSLANEALAKIAGKP